MKISFYQNQTIEAEKKTTENTHNAAARIVKTAVPGACYAGSRVKRERAFWISDRRRQIPMWKCSRII